MPITPPQAGPLAPGSRARALLLTGFLLPQAWAAAPEILTPPQPAEISYRDSAALTVQATGDGVSLQWYAGTSGDLSAPVPGATGPLLLSQPLITTNSFWVRATNADGHTDSPAATVTVRPPVSGRLMGMGENTYRMLFPTNPDSAVPKFILTGATAVSAGTRHNLILKEDFSLWATGDNAFYQLGVDPPYSANDPRQLTTGVVHVAAGGYFSLYIRNDGSLWGMGDNAHGQLGGETETKRTRASQIAGNVADAAGGFRHSAYVTTDGTLWTMGQNYAGQLGDGSTTDRTSPFQAATGVARVYTGTAHTLFIKTDGSLWGMGINADGQLGDGTTDTRLNPVKIAENAVSAAAGGYQSFYRTPQNELRGMGSRYVLGLITEPDQTDDILSPVTLAQNVKYVASGTEHTLFITTDNVLHTLGGNQYGQLGDGTEEHRPLPYAAGLAITAAGRNYHSIFIDGSPLISTQPQDTIIVSGTTATFTAVAEGSGPYTYQWYSGQTGDISQPVAGATDSSFTSSVLRADTPYWVRISNPYGYTDSAPARALVTTRPLVTSLPKKLTVPYLGNAVIAAEVSGSQLTYQWYRGKKGNTSQPVPGATSGLLVTPPLPSGATFWLRATNLAGSVDSAAVAVTVSAPFPGIVMGTGLNSSGQLGIGSHSGSNYSSNVFRETASGVSKISVGNDLSFFVKEDGSFWAFGKNFYGQLGTGGTTDTPFPVQLDTNYALAASRGTSTNFLKTDGSLWSRSTIRATNQSVISKIGDGFATIFGKHSILAVKTDGGLYSVPSNSAPVKLDDNVVKAALGGHALYLKNNGSLWGWGESPGGEIGVDAPFQLVASGVVDIAAGSGHSLFVKSDGTLWGFGSNSTGQLGQGEGMESTTTPVLIATGVTRVAAGFYHTMFLKSNHELWAMGGNFQGQLGDGTEINRYEPVLVSNGVVDIALGQHHSMILQGRPTIIKQPQSVVVAKGKKASLSASARGNGPVTWQWYVGESGDTSNPIPGAKKAIYRSAAVNASYTVWARATNQYGYTDTSSALIEMVTKPLLASAPQATAIRYGDHAAVSVGASGGVLTYTWYEGRPGNTAKKLASHQQPNFISRPLRASTSYWVRVSNAAGFVNSGAIPITVLPRVAGTLMTAGRNQYGQLGNNSTQGSPVRVPVASGVVKTVAGVYNTYFLKDDGTLWGMGFNSSSQLALPPPTTELLPVQIASDVVDVIAGNIYIHFIKSDGTLWGLGFNNHGQLGTGSFGSGDLPVQIATNVVQAAAGEAHTIFVKSDGTAWATGRDTDGEQGNGTDLAGNVLTPAQIATGVAAAAAGEHHTLLLKCDGTLWAAGLNSQGQLGDGTRTSRHSFVPVGSGIRAVTCGDMHTLVRKMDDSLWTLGQNSTQIATDVESVAAGVGYSLYLTRQGELYGWGNNENGQLGNGSLTYQATPVLLGTAHAVACGDYHSAVIVQEAAAGATANATGRAGTIPDPDGDSDGDGLSNLLEHAFASDTLAPGVPPYTLAMQTTGAGAALVLTHRRAIGAAVDFIYEWSDDLADWQAFTPQFQVQPVDSEVETVIATRPIAPGEPAIFLRVRVQEK